MWFFYKKHVIPLFAVWLSLCLVPVGYAHNEKGHAKDIGVVFGFYLEGATKPRTPHGKELRDEVGKIIADLIDDVEDTSEFHRSVNKAIGDICCNSKYCSLYIKGYNQKISDLKDRIKKADRLLEESDRGEDTIQALQSISEEMQNDFFFDQVCSAKASNLKSTLRIFKQNLSYGHDVSSDKVRAAFEELKDTFDKVPEMPQYSQVEVQEKIKDLASNNKLFQWGPYGHRLYFHWGMDAIIRVFSPLEVCINDCLTRTCEELEKTLIRDNDTFRREETDLGGLKEEIRKKIYTLIEEKWEKRKRTALEDLCGCLRKHNNDKLNLNNDQYEMLLKLAYYVHILGDYDYEGSNTSALIPENEIKEALNKLLVDNYWGHPEGNRIMTKLTNGLSSQNTAKDMLIFLKANIPALVDGSPKIHDALW